MDVESRHGTTVLFATHLLEEADALATNVRRHAGAGLLRNGDAPMEQRP